MVSGPEILASCLALPKLYGYYHQDNQVGSTTDANQKTLLQDLLKLRRDLMMIHQDITPNYSLHNKMTRLLVYEASSSTAHYL